MTIHGSKPILDVRIRPYLMHEESVGDTWDPAWAADDRLYFPGNDGSGWNKACHANLFFNKVSGSDPLRLTGETHNGLESDYDGWAIQREDGCTWKSSGCLALDGVLYMAVGRHMYGSKSGDKYNRQTAARASIAKSYDYGLTWERSGADNYHEPMFIEPEFATPYFVHYGQDGQAPDVDRAQEFIYAVSNNGFWCNGDSYRLGRIRREHMERLQTSDWEYYTGGDGALDANWSGRLEDAVPIIERRLQCGETGATYVPSLGRYVLVAWYYPGDPVLETDTTHFTFYESPHPWGPWQPVAEHVSNPEGWYCPRVLSKFQTGEGDGEASAILVTGGDYYNMEKFYKFTVVPIDLSANRRFERELPRRSRWVYGSPANVPDGFRYTGRWTADHSRSLAYGGMEMASSWAGDTAELTFIGTRLKWYASREVIAGIAAVSIDGGDETQVTQYTYAHVPQYRRLLFDSGELSPGEHTLRIRVTGEWQEGGRGAAVRVDAVQIFE